MKRLKNMNILPKTFIITSTLMMCVILITFFIIYLLMPKLYESKMKKDLYQNADRLTVLLEQRPTEQMFKGLTDISEQFNCGIIIYDINDEVVHSAGGYFSINSIGTDSSYSKSDKIIVFNYISEIREFINASGEKFTVKLDCSLQPINDASKAIILMVPYALVACILLSIITSYIYAKAITTSIKSISNATIKMRTLDVNISCTVSSKDEIGVLADNINDMYSKLLSTIYSLQCEIKNVTEAEQEKLEFLQLASHELKTPLTAVTGMIEGMLYNVGVYKDRNTYLGECLKSLNSFTDLIKEILNTSNLNMIPNDKDISTVDVGTYVEQVSEPYKLIALSCHVNFYIDKTYSFSSDIPAKHLAKALSNVISNAVNYTDEDKSVTIYFEQRRIIVENECTPLSDEEISRIYKPFYRLNYSNDKNSSGNGLGLYLTDRIFKLCNVSYEFVPFLNGMRFVIYL